MGRHIFGILILVAAWGATAPAASRVALVVGNSKYETQGTLENAVNDADAMAEALEGLDFKVTKKKDLDKEGMEDALLAFHRALPKQGVGLFFYAGHGIQVRGENYLVPVKARIREEYEVERQCLPVGELLRALEQDQGRLTVVVLDCCRENPVRSASSIAVRCPRSLNSSRPSVGPCSRGASRPGRRGVG